MIGCMNLSGIQLIKTIRLMISITNLWGEFVFKLITDQIKEIEGFIQTSDITKPCP